MSTVTATTTPTLISHDALLMLSNGSSIYDHTRMSGEQRQRRDMLPIDAAAEASGLLNDADEDTLYARSLLGLLSSPRSSKL